MIGGVNMDIFKAVFVFIAAVAVILLASYNAMPFEAESVVAEMQAEVEAFDTGLDASLLEGIDCKAAALYECGTRTMISAKAPGKSLPAGHMAKLAVFLAAAEMIDAGVLSVDETATVSAEANSCSDPQIWLDKGEQITVDELLTAISVGNANDACVALAEYISKKNYSFTPLLERLMSSGTVKGNALIAMSDSRNDLEMNAVDIAELCGELVKHKSFQSYFTTWMSTVRDGRAELVSRNRLIRTYKGVLGFKVCYTEASGYCAAVCAQRGDMTVCCVLMGCKDEDKMLADCAELLDSAFSGYEVYYPEIPEEAQSSVPVVHGQVSEAMTEMPQLHNVIIKKGTYSNISCEYELAESITAPATKGDTVGSIRFMIDDYVIVSSDIAISEEIKEVDFFFVFKRLLFNLLKF